MQMLPWAIVYLFARAMVQAIILWPPRRTGFAHGSGHAACVVDSVVLGQVFLRVLRFSLSNISFHRCSILIYRRPLRGAIALIKQHIIVPSVLRKGLHVWHGTWLEQRKEVLRFYFCYAVCFELALLSSQYWLSSYWQICIVSFSFLN
jgi:hypothetical protein